MDELDKLSETHLYSLRTLKTPKVGRLVARVLLVISSLFFIILFLPWQQNIRGNGKLTTLNPENRPQLIQSAIAGRVTQWHVVEGDFVHKGDTILSISEIKDKYFDPNLMVRMEEQLTAKNHSKEAKQNKIVALRNQIAALRNAQEIKKRQARNKLNQVTLKLAADSLGFVAEQVKNKNAVSTFERNKKRYEAGNITLTKFQEIESKYQMSAAKVLKAENEWLQRKAGLANAQLEFTSIEAEYADKISKSQSNLNETISTLNETIADIAKMENQLSNVRIRQEQYQITAPQSGYIVKAIKAGIGETIKEGGSIATILPESKDVAVEMYVKPMDIPLIELDKKVRVQFDGWPALQFSGWPNASMGTFGGTVSIIDRVQSSNGMFRVLVKPDDEDEQWPDQLRLGSGVKGWIMLNDVPIWYEVWRQMNGFPPTIYQTTEPLKKGKKKK